jgi:hypothetical protein
MAENQKSEGASNYTRIGWNFLTPLSCGARDYSNVIYMNGAEQLHSILIHIRRHTLASKGASGGGSAHEQSKTDLSGCCTLRRSSRFSPNVWRYRGSGGANRQSRHRERFSFAGLLRVLSPSPSSLQVLSPSPSSPLLVAPRLSPLRLVVKRGGP